MNPQDSGLSGFASLAFPRLHPIVVPAALAGLLVISLLTACGKAGPPIAPEDIGVAAKLERERQQKARAGQARPGEPALSPADEEERPPTDGTPREDILLPPLRPIGTQ